MDPFLNFKSKLNAAVLANIAFGSPLFAQDVLPFPPIPSASTAGPTLKESVYVPRTPVNHTPKNAPNILIVLIDDVGPGIPTTFGGIVNAPTLTKVWNQGIAYNRFHTTAMSSPTRASLLTGRNSHRVHSGQITELSNDFDGYSGTIEKNTATVAEVLKQYGYSTGAWGKWHNTPANQTSASGPFEYWPIGYGFQYFYGFLGAEASQYDPNLVRNTSYVHPNAPKQGEKYHLTADIADDAIEWLVQHKANMPDKPFFMYWAPGAVHGPHQVDAVWSDKYKGKFDSGWEVLREKSYEGAKTKGWIPGNSVLTPRPETLSAWSDVPESQRPFQIRLMEIFAGFVEHTDAQVGRLIDAIDEMGYGENTIIFYIWGDNGSSAEGQLGTISELMAQNSIFFTVEQQLEALNELGGLSALGTEKTDNMYHAAWAWAGSSPYRGTKLMSNYFGGTRNPLVVRWPAKINPDKTPRSQFHHVKDIVPTIYEAVGITTPSVVNGIPQESIDGVSMMYTFNNSKAQDQLTTQYFEIMGSRAIYHNGWIAGANGPRTPWVQSVPAVFMQPGGWNPDNDVWELYNLNEDWTQANNIADQNPEKLAEMKQLFMIQAAENKVLPIGAGLLALMRPETMPTSPYTSWTYTGAVTRIPEFCAPKLGNTPNVLIMDVNVPKNANGVLYSLGGFSGGLTCYVKDGKIYYEYNVFEVKRIRIESKEKLPLGKVRIEVETKYVDAAPKPTSPIEVVIKANGKVVAQGIVPISAPMVFTANECLDFGADLGSPVSLDYFSKAPFKFTGSIDKVQIHYLQPLNK